MSVIRKINQVKPALNSVESEAKASLPAELLEQVLPVIKSAKDAVNAAGALIEKYYNDEQISVQIHSDLKAKMAASDVYKPLLDREKDAMIDVIVDSADKNLLTEQDLKKYIYDTLKMLEPEAFVQSVYSRDEIMKLGEERTRGKAATDTVRYEAGMDTLKESLVTFSGMQQALTYGSNTLYENPKTRRQYLKMYYGV